MKTLLAILLLACAAVSAQDSPTEAPPGTPPPGPPPVALPVLPAAPLARAIPVGGVPDAAATNAANSNRLDTLRRQYQDRLAGRVGSNAPALIAPAAVPATRPPAALPLQPPAAVPAVPAGAPAGAPTALSAPASAGALSLPALNDANDPATNRMDFPAVDLNTFLTFYAEFLGRTILRPAALPAQQITLRTQTPLTRREMIHAMDTVLAMNGITTIPVGEKFVKVVQTPNALQEAAQISTLDATNLPEAAQYVVRIVQLKYVKPSEIQPVLVPFGKMPNGVVPIEGSGVVVLRDFAENVKRMLQIIEMVDIAMPAEFVQEVIPIKYAKASEIASALSSLSGGGGSSTSVGGAGGGGGMGGMGGGIGGSRGSSGFGGGSGFGGSSSRSGFGARGGMGNYQGGNAGMPGASPFGGASAMGQPGVPGAAGGSFSDRLRSIITKASSGDFQIIGPNKILADENSNQLLVFATRQDMIMIKEIISKLDTISPQVLIEALLLKVVITDTFDLAFDYLGKGGNNFVLQRTKADVPNTSQGDSPLSLGTNVTGSFNWLGKVNENFYFRMKAEASAGRVSVLQRPRIQTSHAQPATFFTGETRPYPTGTSYGGYGGNYSQIQQMNIGTTLQVVPLINQDGLVVLEIQQQISRPGATVTIQGVGDVPSTTETSVSAKVSVRTGETIVLGGFISSDSDKKRGGVPFLMDLPLLGVLFRSTGNLSTRNELIILIRPTVLPNPQDAAIAAAKMKESMPLIRTAEVELQTDWERYQKIANEVESQAARRKDGSKADYGPWDPNEMQFKDATNGPPATTP
jgi:general secretion pathway protein D